VDLGSGIPEFSLKAFHKYLVNFIIANDQVMNIFQSAQYLADWDF
jgi:hypothetical protein